MNIKTILSCISCLLFMACTLSSCQWHTKYDDDDVRALIQANTEAIQKNKATLDSLQNVLTATGAYITKVEKYTTGNGGIAIYTNGNSTPYKISNGATGDTGATGAAGKEAVLWTIGTDGMWYKNGEVTAYPANGTNGTNGTNGKDGTNGEKGDTGDKGTDGIYYVPNANGTFDKVENGTTTSTDIKWAIDQHLSASVDATTGNLLISGYGLSGTITIKMAKITAIEVDKVSAPEVHNGYPAFMFVYDKDESTGKKYKATITFLIKPTIAAGPTTENIQLLTSQLATRSSNPLSFEIYENNYDTAKGVLKLGIKCASLPLDNQNLFAIQVKIDGTYTITSDYAAAFAISGKNKHYKEPESGTNRGTDEQDVDWVQLWAGGPRFSTENMTKQYQWGALEYVDYSGNADNERQYKGTEFGDDGNLPTYYDTATHFWGDQWKTPSKDVFHQLISKCNPEYKADYNGKKGFLFKGAGNYSSNTLFLPTDSSAGSSIYWTSTHSSSTRAFDVSMPEEGTISEGDMEKHYNYFIRPILK